MVLPGSPDCVCAAALLLPPVVAAVAALRKPKKAHIYMRKPIIFRVACVMACAAALINGTPNWAAVNHEMKEWLKDYNKGKPKAQQISVSRGYGHLKTYWGDFVTYGSVADAPRAPKPCKIPVHAARRAAVLVKCGQEVTTRVRNQDFNYHSYYTSIEQACEKCTELEQIRVQYNATHAQLLVAMHKADRSLVYRKIFFKHTLTPAELLERSGFGAAALERLRADPRFLSKIIFIDEASIVINDKTKSDVHAWCDMYDLSFTDVCPIPLHKGEEITVRWICAVSAHEAFADKGGLVYFEFTTGTTKIHRRVNTKLDGSTVDHSFAYTVSWLHPPKAVVAVTVDDIIAVAN